MRLLFIFIPLLAFSKIFSQKDSSRQDLPVRIYTNVNTLTRADIERLPVVNFLEMVQGAFPFLGNESFIEEKYSFVVNGFILLNPNAINISQIETISFYPAGTSLTRGNLNKNGTFVIITKPEKTAFNFSTKTGLLFADHNSFGQSFDISKSAKGLYSLNELGYNHKAQKWFASSALSFLKNDNPNLIVLRPYTIDDSSYEWKRFRFSNFAGYEFNSKWKVQAGLFFAAQPADAETESNFARDGQTTFDGLKGNSPFNGHDATLRQAHGDSLRTITLRQAQGDIVSTGIFRYFEHA